MNIFVLGGSGFIGRSIITSLVAHGHSVRALARSDRASSAVSGVGATAVSGSLADIETLRKEAGDADAVIMAAQENSADGVAQHRAAVEATVAALRAGAPYLYTSGCWVYGDRGDAIVAEDAPLNPVALVAWRPAVEQVVLARTELRGIVIRAGVVYGDGGGIPGMMVAEGNSGTVRVVGSGANRWSTVRHDALGELFALALESADARGIYNAARGAAVPYAEIARAASRAAGKDGSVMYIDMDQARKHLGPFADALAADCQIDATRAETELGWTPHRPTLLEELSNTTVV